MSGAEVFENAEARDSRWLRAVQPPFSALADRRTCSEYQLFDALCERLYRGGCTTDDQRLQVHGFVNILVSAPPCVSCLGLVRQFQLMFPAVTLQVAGGQLPSIEILGNQQMNDLSVYNSVNAGAATSQDYVRLTHHSNLPRVVLTLPGIVVLNKPSGWETDSAEPVAECSLSSPWFLLESPKEDISLLRDVSLPNFGFLHQLDFQVQDYF